VEGTRIKESFDSAFDITFAYDQSDVTNGEGRLTKREDESGLTRYSYDSRGNLTTETRTIGGTTYGVAYTYNLNNRLMHILHRSNTANPRYFAVERENATQQAASLVSCVGCHYSYFTVAQNIKHEPLGPMRSLSLGNSLEVNAEYNQRYQMCSLQSGSIINREYGYDDAGNITSIDKNGSPYELLPPRFQDNTYTYDYDEQGGEHELEITDNASEL